MIRFFLIFFVSTISLSLYAQKDSTEIAVYFTKDSFSYALGDSQITINTYQYDSNSKLVFVNLHHNERTSVAAATEVLKQYGGFLLEIVNDEKRNISFSYRDKNYLIDPNRIFTKTGIIATLKKNKTYSAVAVPLVQQFAAYLLHYIPAAETVIALHNNTPDKYSIRSYKKGGPFYKDASAVYIAKDKDEDDFFLTTSLQIYRKLKGAHFNVVLQHNAKATDDGSLSIYYGRKGKGYVNVEAEEGHLTEQIEMIRALVQIIQQNGYNVF